MNYEQLSELIVTRLFAVIGSYESIMMHSVFSYEPPFCSFEIPEIKKYGPQFCDHKNIDIVNSFAKK